MKLLALFMLIGNFTTINNFKTKMEIEIDKYGNTKQTVVINGKKLACPCGKPIAGIKLDHGQVQVFCLDCMPEENDE